MSYGYRYRPASMFARSRRQSSANDPKRPSTEAVDVAAPGAAASASLTNVDWGVRIVTPRPRSRSRTVPAPSALPYAHRLDAVKKPARAAWYA